MSGSSGSSRGPEEEADAAPSPVARSSKSRILPPGSASVRNCGRCRLRPILQQMSKTCSQEVNLRVDELQTRIDSRRRVR